MIYLARGSEGDETHVEQDEHVEILAGGRQIVMHHEHRLAALTQLVQQRDDRRFGRGIDAGERLIHEVKIALLREGAGQEDSLLLAAGEIRNLPVGEGQHLHLVETGSRDFAILLAGTLHEPNPPIAAHQDHVHDVDREVPVHRFALRNVADAAESFLERAGRKS